MSSGPQRRSTRNSSRGPPALPQCPGTARPLRRGLVEASTPAAAARAKRPLPPATPLASENASPSAASRQPWSSEEEEDEVQRQTDRASELQSRVEGLGEALANEKLSVKRLAAMTLPAKRDGRDSPPTARSHATPAEARELMEIRKRLEIRCEEATAHQKKLSNQAEELACMQKSITEERAATASRLDEFTQRLDDARTELKATRLQKEAVEAKLRTMDSGTSRSFEEIESLRAKLQGEQAKVASLHKEVENNRTKNSPEGGRDSQLMTREALQEENGRLRWEVQEKQNELRKLHSHVRDVVRSEIETAAVTPPAPTPGPLIREKEPASRPGIPKTGAAGDDKLKGLMSNIRSLSKSLQKK